MIEPHVLPAIKLLTTEYFNMFDDACQKLTSLTIAFILKCESEYYDAKGISTSLGEKSCRKHIDDILERCDREISESPESITAFLATDLISTILANSNKSFQEYVLKQFLLEKIIEPLIE